MPSEHRERRQSEDEHVASRYQSTIRLDFQTERRAVSRFDTQGTLMLKRSFVVAALFCAACGSNAPSTPTPLPSQAVTPAPNFQGQYSGTYVISSCNDDGGFTVVELCRAINSDLNSPRSARLPIALSLIQNNGEVTGTITLASTSGTFRGSVSTSGNLSATAVLSTTMVCCGTGGVTVAQTHNITSWNTTLSGNTLVGAFTFVVRYSTTTDNSSATLNATMVDVTR
jgi:hypothetical protein